jgi:hypothetical protein
MTYLEAAQMVHRIAVALGYGTMISMAMFSCLMGLACIADIFNHIVNRLLGNTNEREG